MKDAGKQPLRQVDGYAHTRNLTAFPVYSRRMSDDSRGGTEPDVAVILF
jgi:hypothetical protein